MLSHSDIYQRITSREVPLPTDVDMLIASISNVFSCEFDHLDTNPNELRSPQFRSGVFYRMKEE